MREVKNQRQLEYEQSLFPHPDPLMIEARQQAEKLRLLGISLSFSEASLLRLMVELSDCSKFVEIGTLTGFSALSILEGLKVRGQLWTFEKNPVHAKIADDILQKKAQQKDQTVRVLVGDAEEQLPSISDQAPFDGIFIDGNKSAYLRYLDWAEVHLKVGGLILADNVFLEGSVWGQPTEKFKPKQIEVMKEFGRRLSNKQNYIFSLVSTSEGLIIAKKISGSR